MSSKQAFAGLKVLALARVYAAPFAAYQLALQGADVINIEEPGKGDSARALGGEHAKDLVEQGLGPAFLAHGANKRSLTLNLRKPEGQAIFRHLAKDADIVIENLRVGDMDRYGVGYAALSALNPRLIYASLTGYGQTGPKKRDAAIDIVIQAASGLMSITGTPESGPVKVGSAVIDYIAGLSLTAAILTALHHRHQTGEGQQVDVSMLESALVAMSAIVSDVQNAGLKPALMGNRTANNMPVANSLMCSDVPVVISATNPDRRKKLFDAMGRQDLLDDPRFVTPQLIRRNWKEVYAEMEKTLKTRTAAEWEDVLNRAGVPCMRVSSVAEASTCEQIEARGLYHTIQRMPGVDRPVKVPPAPFKLSKVETPIHLPPPLLGAHTEEILIGSGYSADDIRRFREDGVI
jgi:crotonobetainyl-CoA:carnitine CoA-transferase CaiB-like acyl-CoA transferase